MGQARSFAEMLEQAERRYQNRAIDAVQVLEELIKLARQMREATAKVSGSASSEEELASTMRSPQSRALKRY